MGTSTVFEIAKQIMQRLEAEEIETVKLQKLCFYAFGWYAHLTGSSLFAEPVYAMKRGPVVGELLACHAKQKQVSISDIEKRIYEPTTEIDPYTSRVLDFVALKYGSLDSWSLVELTHKEKCWKQAWTMRPEEKKRADMHPSEIIEDFISKPSQPGLPDRSITVAADEVIDRMDETAEPYLPFVEAFVKEFAS